MSSDQIHHHDMLLTSYLYSVFCRLSAPGINSRPMRGINVCWQFETKNIWFKPTMNRLLIGVPMWMSLTYTRPSSYMNSSLAMASISIYAIQFGIQIHNSALSFSAELAPFPFLLSIFLRGLVLRPLQFWFFFFRFSMFPWWNILCQPAIFIFRHA